MNAWINSYTISDDIDFGTEPQVRYVSRSLPNPISAWLLSIPTSASIRFSREPRFFKNLRILRLLKEYENFQENWAGDDSPAPNQNTINSAKSLTYLLSQHGQPIYHAAPGPNGEIMLDIRNTNRTKSLEIIFYPTRNIVALFPAGGSPTQKAFQTEELPSLLTWLNT